MPKAASDISVMIAEDDANIQDLFCAIMASLGIKDLTQVRNGVQAYDEIVLRPYDIILMDVSMPVLSGIDAHRKIQLHRPDQKVVFVTGLFDDDEIGDLVKKENAFGYIKKPFDIQLIRDLIFCIAAAS